MSGPPSAWAASSPEAPARCTIWWADLALLAPRHLGVLDAHEGRRREAFHDGTDQQRFTLGAVLLRLAASTELRVAPQDVVVRRVCATCDGAHGRPSVAAPAARRGASPWRAPGELHVSVAHSGDQVVVATTWAGPVGVDIEVDRPIDVERFLPRTNGPSETRPVNARQFLTTWTRKESLLKATGVGIATDLRAVEVGPPAEPARLLSWRGGPPAARMHDLTQPTAPGATAPGAVGCVSVLTPDAVSFDERRARRLTTDHPTA